MNVVIFTSTDEIYGFGRNYGAYLIASALRQAGYTAMVVDFFKTLTESELNDIVDQYIGEDTIWVGFSSSYFMDTSGRQCDKRPYPFPYSQKFMSSFVDRIKNINEKIKFVYGGVHTRVWYNRIPFIDLYVYDYAEEFVVTLTKAWERGISAIWPDREAYPRPVKNYYLPMLWSDDDFIFDGEALPIEYSRGCTSNCPFCNYRMKNKEHRNLKDEFIRNYEKWNVTDYIFVDANITKDINAFMSLWQTIKILPFKINFGCFGRVGFFSKYPEAIHMLKEMGCQTIKFGIESLNEKTLEVIGKGPDPYDQVKTLMYMKEQYGDEIRIASGFIAGLPYEDKADILRMLEWLDSGQTPLDEFIIYPLSMPTEESFKNDFVKHPDKWGYKITDNGWVSTTSDMTEEKAKALVNTYYNNKDFIKSTISYTFPFRLKNLGFTDTFDINIKSDAFKLEMGVRRSILKDVYIDKLLK